MLNFFFISLFNLLLIAYLTGFFDKYRSKDLSYNTLNNVSLIEFLTQFKNKGKIYNKAPKGFSTYNKLLSGKKINEKVLFRYEYPLIKSQIGIYETTLLPADTSQLVDFYGLQDYLINKTSNGYKLNTNISENEFQSNMNKDGWYFNSYDDAGLDYKYLVFKYAGFCSSIAHQIYTDLSKKENDSYFNRVQAALNFVQFIPYGRPDFDSKGWYYHELGVPPEVFVLGYGDCDSKSVFFASILVNLIPIENILLIGCLVKSENDKTNGAHMMAAVSGLGIQGESVRFNNQDFLLLETTQPVEIGQFGWESFRVDEIYNFI